MKQKTLGILNIIMGITSIIYLLIQNGTIKLNMFIVDYQYNDDFDKFFAILMIILSLFSIILIILNIFAIKRIKKNTESLNVKPALTSNGYSLCIGGEVINVIGWALIGSATIFSLIIIIGGAMILLKAPVNKTIKNL